MAKSDGRFIRIALKYYLNRAGRFFNRARNRPFRKDMALQMTMFGPKSEWVPPAELPDIFDAKQIAIDVETKDPNLKSNGPGWPTGDGEVVGYAVAVADWLDIPIRIWVVAIWMNA